MVSEVEHLPLVSDELFAAAQERFRGRPRSNGRTGSKTYLLTGMVRCASGHQPLAMYGRTRKQHTYMTCDYGRTYGKVAADQIEGHGQWLSIREDALLPLVEQFFADGSSAPCAWRSSPASCAPTRRPPPSRRRDPDATAGQVADLDDRIGKQIEALEQGSSRSSLKRIEKLRKSQGSAETDLRALIPSAPA